jgi:hypothetical protein
VINFHLLFLVFDNLAQLHTTQAPSGKNSKNCRTAIYLFFMYFCKSIIIN